MIKTEHGIAKIDTPNTTLILRLDDRPEIVYYGDGIGDCDDFSFFGFAKEKGCFSSADDVDLCKTVISASGDGNNAENMIRLVDSDGAGTLRPVLVGAKVCPKKPELCGLPSSYGEESALVIEYIDKAANVKIKQYFATFSDSDVIAAGITLENVGDKPFFVRRLMSLQLDFEGADGFEALTLDGAWGRERIPHKTALSAGSFRISSISGMSGNAHNPFMLLSKRGIGGYSVGCNLVYSGNHLETVDISSLGRTRLLAGMNDYMLNFRVNAGEKFCSPEAVFVRGCGDESVFMQMRGFVAEHIVRGFWKSRPRPIVVNSWESVLYNFDRGKLLSLCDRAAEIGAEMFVLDDGWFGKRDSDRCSLGDWHTNVGKIGSCIGSFADEVRSRGLKFGIWIEPEMISKTVIYTVIIPNMR